jgi:hypothetical protein
VLSIFDSKGTGGGGGARSHATMEVFPMAADLDSLFNLRDMLRSLPECLG